MANGNTDKGTDKGNGKSKLAGLVETYEATKADENVKLPTDAAVKKLFAAAMQASNARQEALAALEQAKAAESQAIAEIVKARGTGPFRHKGEVIYVGCRGESLFFKRPKQTDVIDV